MCLISMGFIWDNVLRRLLMFTLNDHQHQLFWLCCFCKTSRFRFQCKNITLSVDTRMMYSQTYSTWQRWTAQKYLLRSNRTYHLHQWWTAEQALNKKRLFLGENFGEVLPVGNTSASQKLQKFLIAFTWLTDVIKVFSLWPRDALESSKLVDKHIISFKTIRELNTVHLQSAPSSFVQRTHVCELSFSLCSSNLHRT